MKIVFVSNYFNHHQKPFCDEMFEKLGEDFTFISTTVMREERKKLGYEMDEYPEYVLLSYENDFNKKKAISLINQADAVIAGSALEEMLSERIASGKLLLRYSERPFKLKTSILKKVYHFFNLRKRDLFKKNIYLLCAGAYTAKDFASVGMYENRTYKWGYFPEVKEHNTDSLFAEKQTDTIIWCGRFLDWKHPDDALRLVAKLKEQGYCFRFDMIGTGVMEDELRELAKELGISDVVRFLGAMPPDEVRSFMEKAGIFLFTSDRQEGWGAVLNEAMNSGCAVVASDAIGSVPYLINEGENGTTYPSGNIDALVEKVAYLLEQPEKQKEYGINAYDTVYGSWNAAIAAERICLLIERLLEGKEVYPDIYSEGPCSKA